MSSFKTSLMRTAAAASLIAAFGVPAVHAQTEPAATAAKAPPTEDAADQSADSTGVEEIVVTAQFRATNLQKTPLAISAVSGDQLVARGQTDINAIGTTAPSVTITPASGIYGKTVFTYIRGVGVGDYDPAFDPAVGYYIDGIYYSVLVGTTFELMDLERVEVLRGPQGTLFGKNTIGGAIRLISKAPSGKFEGFGEVTYGSRDLVNLRAGVNIPLIGEDLAVRISGIHKRRDGFVTEYDFACRNPLLAGSIPSSPRTGSNCIIGHEGGENVDGGRIALRARPTSNLEINLSADYTDDRSQPPAQILLATDNGPGLNGPGNPAAGVLPVNTYFNIPTFGVPYDDRFICGNFCSYASHQNPLTGQVNSPEQHNRLYGFAATIDFDVSDNLKIKSITGYRNTLAEIHGDADASPLSLSLTHFIIDQHQVSQELQLLGSLFHNQLEWVIGGYYFKGNVDNFNNADLGVAGIIANSSNKLQTRDYSAFAHLTYHVTDKLNVIGGVRFTDEAKDFTIAQTYGAYIPTFPGAFIFPNAIPPINMTAPTLKYKRWNPKVSVDYQVTPDALLYAQFSTGFRGGGFNDRPFTPNQIFQAKPESLRAYEIGAKTQWFDRHLTVNLTAFQSDYTGLQQVVSGVDSVGFPFFAVLNTGKARIRGLEFESTVRSGGLELSLNADYLDAKIVKTQAPDPSLGLNLAPSALPQPGTRLAYTPKFKFNAGAQYTADIDGLGTLTPRFDLSYQSSIQYDTTGTVFSRQKGYAVANGRLTWAPPVSGLTVALGVTNLFDNYYYVGVFNGFTPGVGFQTASPARPREWSLTVRKSF